MVSIRRSIAAAAVAACALGGLSACSDKSGRPESAPAPSSQTATQVSIPSAADLTALLDKASDPAVPVDQKINLVEGGAQAPQLFEQIAAVKQQKGATVQITDSAEGDLPGTVIANAVIKQAGQQDINVQAKFVQMNGQWMLQQSFACALISNAGLQAPAICAAGSAPAAAPTS